MKMIKVLILAFIASCVFFLPKIAYAIDVTMGTNGVLAFQPADVTINAGETVHFINNSLPHHNIIVEAHPELSRESLMFNPGESQDVIFAEVGDYEFFCAPHRGAGMTGTVHVK